MKIFQNFEEIEALSLITKPHIESPCALPENCYFIENIDGDPLEGVEGLIPVTRLSVNVSLFTDLSSTQMNKLNLGDHCYISSKGKILISPFNNTNFQSYVIKLDAPIDVLELFGTNQISVFYDIHRKVITLD